MFEYNINDEVETPLNLRGLHTFEFDNIDFNFDIEIIVKPYQKPKSKFEDIVIIERTKSKKQTKSNNDIELF